MRIHDLSCGTLHPKLMGGKHMICHCLLIETPAHGLVLVDAGFGTKDLKDPASRMGKAFAAVMRAEENVAHAAVSQVEALGYKADDVRHIVLTHMDLDHTGGLADFPHATVHVHANEYAVAMERPDWPSKNRYIPAMWEHAPKFETYADTGSPWFGFDAVRDLRGLPPEILLIPLHGHSRGHTGVAVQGDGGWALHAGDSYFNHGEVHERVRQCPIPLRIFQTLVEVDRTARLNNQDRLRDLAHSANAVRIFSAHDPSELHA